MEKVKRKRIGRRILSFVLSLVLTLGLLPEIPGVKLVVQAAEGITITIDTGAQVTIKDTDEDTYYEISTPDELYAFAAAVNGGNNKINGELTADIVVNESLEGSPRVWTPIGWYSFVVESFSFSGNFNGAGHTISGLYCHDGLSYLGLFGYIDASATEIQNVGVINSSFSGKNYVGGICGFMVKGCITNCYNTGSVSGTSNVGGICGGLQSSYNGVTNCYNTGSVSGTSNVGGVYGYTRYDSGVTNSYYLDNRETDGADGTTFKTEADFKSGAVCWLLNNSTASDDSVWGQSIGIDTLPVFGGSVVYFHEVNGTTFYSNMKTPLINNDGVYEIDSADGLCAFVEMVNIGQTAIDAKLTADIYLNGVNWTQMESFSGTFDGDGHTISGLNGQAGNDTDNVKGFIATLGTTGVVKNLIFSAAKVFNNTETNGSSVIACTNRGRIENCKVINSTIQLGAYERLGVVVGENSGTIVNCASVSNTVHRRYGKQLDVCGFVWSNSGTIENCYTYDCTYKSGVNRYAFTRSNTGTITNCYYYEPSETLSDTAGTAKNAEQFATGEVAYLLNGSTSTGTLAWYQNLSGNETDTYPVHDSTHGTVYRVNKYDCPDDNVPEVVYGNSAGDIRTENHTWENSVCTICGEECTTHTWENSECSVCGKECTTHNWVDGECSICKEVCTHSWENSVCTICGEECTTHTWENSECSVCGKECTTHNWVDGACSICKEVCTHSWENSVCSICGEECTTHTWENGECSACGKECTTHTWENGECSICKEVCTHSWENSVCSICGEECTTHVWKNGECTICGFQYVKDITIKLADGTAFGEGEYTFDHDTKVHTINTTKNVTISGTTTKETIVVAKNVSANITLAGVTIDVSDTDNACALKIEGDGTGTVTITLADKTTNTLNSGDFCAGLQIEKVSGYENPRKLIIDGTGALDATSGGNGAGIGGGHYGDAGSITINGGTISATGGWGGAGIGGGFQGDAGNITINGGTIEATGGSDGAGIGGGHYGAGGSITINGGNVKTVGTNTVPVKGTLQNDAGEPLYLHTITLNGITEKTAITAIAADVEYGLKDVKTLDTNKLYVYLPFASMPYEVDAGGNCYYGKLTGDVEKEGTFYKVSFEKNSDTEMTGTGEEISTVISIAVPSDNKYTGAAIEAVVTDNYNENAQGMVQYEALEGTLTPVVVTMAPAPTPTPEPQVSFAPEPSVEPSSTPEVTDEPSGSSAPSGPSTPVRLSAALPATSWEPAPAPTEIPVTKNMPVNQGTYKASITLDGETIFVTYDIVARTLQASDFTFTAPEGAVYDGNTHQAAVESALEGMGEITIAYYDEAGNPVNGIPVDAGTYTVKISVSEGENCNAAECLTDDSWTFTIEKKAITITAEDKSVCVNCEEPAFTYVVDGLVEDDVLLTEPVMDSNADMVVTGNYAITPSAADAGSNYSITYVPGTLTVTEHLNDVDDFKCDVCGAIVDGVDLRGSNLTLNGNIGLNLFFEIDEEVKAEILADETAIIRFNLPDGSVREVPANEGTEDTTAVVGTTLYKYPCELTAKQMTDKVKVQFVTDGNVIAEYEYSIADYAAVIIANAEGKYSAESIALVKAMLNYGAYAQKNFGYNAEKLANAQLAENEKSLSSVTVDTFETSKASGMIVDGLGTFAGSSLVLKSETTLKVYFEPAEGVTAEDLTFTVDGEEVTATTSGEYLVISITDIKAQELDKVFAVKVTDGNKEGNFNACVFAYCYSVLSDTTGRFSEELKDVVKALYLYNMAADAYFN